MSGPVLPDVPSVEPEEVGPLLEQGALLVDVREQVEWDEARIAGADLRPVSTIQTWWEELPRDRTVIVYCRSGNRSAQVCHALATQLGFDNLLNLSGGILAWSERDLPLEP